MLSRKQQRHLAKLEATLGGDHIPVAATDSRRPARGLHLSEHVTAEHNPYQVADTRLAQLLQKHRRRRARGQVRVGGGGQGIGQIVGTGPGVCRDCEVIYEIRLVVNYGVYSWSYLVFVLD